jgi:hypothetical protein
MLLELPLALVLSPAAADETLVAADTAAQAHNFARAAEICLELASDEETEPQTRQDAVLSGLGYANMAYTQEGDVSLLCRAYTVLLEHGRGELLELKPKAEHHLESIAGPSWHSICFPVEEAPEVPPAPVVPAPVAAPAATALPAPQEDASARPRPSRPLVIAGGTLVSLGVASFAGMTAALVVWDRNTDAIYDNAAALGQGVELTPARISKVEQLADSNAYLKPLAITTGVLGAVAVITGAALLIAGRKRSRELSVTPTLTPTFGGLSLQARF